ncbi:MAG: maleylpyruvate isomerase family mycothiol-dependent enzyme [Nocardioides sp.]
MAPTDLYAVLAAEVTRFGDRLERAVREEALDAPVPCCPGWAVRDLAHHLGTIERWVCHAVDHASPDAPDPGLPTDSALVEWYRRGAADLLGRLEADPATPAWTFGPTKDVGFWWRRQAHEHRLHRWDLEAALGEPTPLDPALADDGVAEVVTMFWPRQVRLGRAEPPADALGLVATDTGGQWRIGGEGPLVATLGAPAGDLLLALWHRLPADAPALIWNGDEAAGRAILALPLAP